MRFVRNLIISRIPHLKIERYEFFWGTSSKYSGEALVRFHKTSFSINSSVAIKSAPVPSKFSITASPMPTFLSNRKFLISFITCMSLSFGISFEVRTLKYGCVENTVFTSCRAHGADLRFLSWQIPSRAHFALPLSARYPTVNLQPFGQMMQINSVMNPPQF